MPFEGDPNADHPLVQDYYTHQPFKPENAREIKMTQVEIIINGKGPFLSFVTDQFAKRNEPDKDIHFFVTTEVWPK